MDAPLSLYRRRESVRDQVPSRANPTSRRIFRLVVIGDVDGDEIRLYTQISRAARIVAADREHDATFSDTKCTPHSYIITTVIFNPTT